MIKNLTFLFSFSVIVFCFPQHSISQQQLSSSDLAAHYWVDSIYQSLNWEQRIGQLIMIRANQPDKPYDERIESYIKLYNLGGVCFFRGQAREQLIQTNRWQQQAATPLFIGIDAEWGLAMRIPGTVSYPLQITLGAVQDNQLIYTMGQQIAEQCKAMGIHFNFAPVVDVNNNAANPVIGVRSFGENPDLVVEKAWAYAKGLQEGNIIPTAKHFPGHGDTQTDSHYALPLIPHTRAHLDSIELKPFRELIEKGIEGVMSSHLFIPALDTQQRPATLSYTVVTQLLKHELGFNGIVVTDGLDMKGVTQGEQPGMVELKALMAGNDILLLPENVPVAVATIMEAMEKDQTVKERIEESCKKILLYKYRTGLNQYRPVNPEAMESALQQPQYHQVSYELFASAITMLKNEQETLPLGTTDKKKAFLTVGSTKSSLLYEQLVREGINMKHYQLPKNPSPQQLLKLETDLKQMDEIIISIENTNILAQQNFGIENDAIRLIEKVSKTTPATLVLFASPYALDLFSETEMFNAILIGFQDRIEAKQAVAAIMTGKQPAKGKLPVSLKSGYRAGSGLTVSTPSQTQPHTTPWIEEPIQIAEKYSRQIDSIAISGIKKKAYPGCAIIALLDGKPIYNKQFGFLTYDNLIAVTDSTLYDLASLTKILASTLAVMKLYEEKKLSLDASLSSFFPYLKDTDKASISLMDILTHQSGFDGWIPFYSKLITNNGFDSSLFSSSLNLSFPVPVSDHLFLNKNYRYKLFDEIASSRLKKKEYRYSDLGFYFMPDLIELTTNQPFELYLQQYFYQPMGLGQIGFNPLEWYPKDRIAPTEYDRDFRRTLLQGTVHDQGAALMGGVSGHAGLFGTAADVADLMQMLLNKGLWNGQQLLKSETVEYFTQAHFAQKDNRRGIGFDKPPLDPKDKNRSIAMVSSMQSFGHTGFTGVIAWADPNNKLVFVFLSNRVYPDAKINRLAKLNIRSDIHELLYKAVADLTVNISTTD